MKRIRVDVGQRMLLVFFTQADGAASMFASHQRVLIKTGFLRLIDDNWIHIIVPLDLYQRNRVLTSVLMDKNNRIF